MGEVAIADGMESYFDGVLDEVAIFDFSATAADIQLLYNSSRTLDSDQFETRRIVWGMGL